MSAAIRMGTEGPPVLQQYLTERILWQNFGLTKKQAKRRPHLELNEYMLIARLIQREETAQANRRR
jgi:hypothetical protein